MIPKVIHYCWFGGNPLPELAVKCIESWKRYCPDYEIREWNEDNFDLDCCSYVRGAYAEKKWAFVSDYARFKILYEYGGVYFDTDVELIKPIDDIIEHGPFMGLEKSDKPCIASGLGMAADAGLELMGEILESYDHSHFVPDDNGFYENVVARVTNIILKHGAIDPDKISEIAGITVYPSDYFCPLNFYNGEFSITANTRSIHHYTASWFSNKEIIILKINHMLGGHKLLAICATIPLRILNKIDKLGFFGTVKFSVSRFTQTIRKILPDQ